MFSHLRQWIFVGVLGLASIGASAPASAGMPVIDAANLAQAIQEVLSWGQQLEGMARSYQQLQNTYSSLTGPRGMQNLLYVPLPTRNYLPVNSSQMTGVINGTSTAYPLLSSQVQTNIQTNAVLTPQGVSGLSPQAQQYVRLSRQAAAVLSMLSQQNQANASNNFSNVQTLISALGATADTKASADLSGRIQSEQVMTQTNQIKTDALYQSVQAQQLQAAQLAREAAVKQQGAQSALTPIAW
jgi:type IV secretion system protein VirB5